MKYNYILGLILSILSISACAMQKEVVSFDLVYGLCPAYRAVVNNDGVISCITLPIGEESTIRVILPVTVPAGASLALKYCKRDLCIRVRKNRLIWDPIGESINVTPDLNGKKIIFDQYGYEICD